MYQIPFFLYAKIMERFTFLETNVAPEKWWLGDDPCFRGYVIMLILGRVYYLRKL